jgi:hypothetical protein
MEVSGMREGVPAAEGPVRPTEGLHTQREARLA